MDWKGIVSVAMACLVAGLALGFALGMRGCSGGSSRLLQDNAELRAEVERHRFLADDAEDRRAIHAVKRNDAERELALVRERETVSAGEIKRLRSKVARAGRKRDERDELIDAYVQQTTVKDEQVDMMAQALEAAKAELEEGHEVEARLRSALVTSEERADKLEKHVLKERPRNILIGVGSAIGGAGVMALAVYGAGRL